MAKPLPPKQPTVPPVLYSAAMGLLGAGLIGVTVFLAGRAAGVLGDKLLYQAIVFGAFFGLYMVMPGGFETNFNTPEKKKMTIADVLYYTMVVHSTAGFGEIYPTTFYARICVATHLGLVFLGTAGLLSLP
ncbi:MAG: hypothetical protein EBS48_06595 [Actinobacteria bacterium]|nr:hypothetical protein [Actinomycetota bacterium]